jgi:hypothetical protein
MDVDVSLVSNPENQQQGEILGLLNEKDLLQAEKGKENGEDETLLVTFLNEKQKKRRTIRKGKCQRNLVSSLPRGISTVVDESVEVRETRTRW